MKRVDNFLPCHPTKALGRNGANLVTGSQGKGSVSESAGGGEDCSPITSASPAFALSLPARRCGVYFGSALPSRASETKVPGTLGTSIHGGRLEVGAIQTTSSIHTDQCILW